ncbi:MAG TPA: hypothetical protein VI670_21710 [Thermoanaerobaculia bacterium]|jgi:hypothetical protein
MLTRSLLLVALVATVARGKELRVPGDYRTIQGAIDAAAGGDEIVVAAGTYHELLDTAGKKIVVRSSDGPEVTILDGGNLGRAILTATHGETLATTIRGFTFQHGRGTITTACGFRNAHLGGAILLLNGGLSVADCIFKDNASDDVTTIVAGGAICACRSDLTISDSRFDHNDAAYGGAVYYNTPVSRAATIEHSTFNTNGPNGGAIKGFIAASASVTIADSTFDRNQGAAGSGVELEGFDRATAFVWGATFTGNVATHGGGIYAYVSNSSWLSIAASTFDGNDASFGAGAFISIAGTATAEVVESTFRNNHASFGGGLFAGSQGSGARIRLERSRFTDNEAVSRPATGIYADGCYTDGLAPQGNGLYYGGGADLRAINGGSITVVGCLFAANKAVRGGGAHASSCAGGTVRFVNTTIADNGTSGLHLRQGFLNSAGDLGSEQIGVTNSILYGNGGNQLVTESGPLGGTPAVEYSDVQSGFPGRGNFDAPPGFAAPQARDYRLTNGSPCIDAGNNGALDPGTKVDLADRPRFVDDPATPDRGLGASPVVDLGAFEFPLAARRRAAGRP